MTDAGSVDAAVAAHVERFGGLDVMVANAGVAVTAPLVETTAAQWQTTLAVNLTGVFHCYAAAARQLVAQGRGGRIIGAGSVAAHRGGKWQSAYSATKFAVRGMSQSLAQELAEHGITVNVYSPGVVQTPMWDSIDVALAGRNGTPGGLGDAGDGRRHPARPPRGPRRRRRGRVVPRLPRLRVRHRPVDRRRRGHVVQLTHAGRVPAPRVCGSATR